MARQKSSAQIQVADGAGGMRAVVDLRFEDGEWPITLEIPAKDVETWMAHLGAESEERGWSSSSFGQHDAAENSGTLSLHTASGPTPPTLEIVWERQRNAGLRLRARLSGTPLLSLVVVHDFIDAVSTRQRAGKTLKAHRRAILTYHGLPWRGELWLDPEHRLGPPTKHPDSLLGPQALILDAMIEGIGQWGVTANFQTRLHEICVFLSVVLGLNIETSRFENAWVCDIDDQGRITDCKLWPIGYAEPSDTPPDFPPVGSVPPIERRRVTRPSLGPFGIRSDMHEQWVPADIDDLWLTFNKLPRPKREHFLRAGNAYLTAHSMWPDHRTAYVVFLVVACEALKPMGRKHDKANIYDVVASLVSPSEAEILRKLSLDPQKIRNKHLHRGELAAGELLPVLVHDYFLDPSFDEMLMALSRISRVSLIAWLLRGGEYTLSRLPRTRRTGLIISLAARVLEQIARVKRCVRGATGE